MAIEAEWEPDAENWLQWARTPGFDAYWYYRDAFFGAILPSAGPRTLEVGCGEGRVARDLAARGHAVVAVDAAPTLVRHANAADAGGVYAVAAGAALPFGDAVFHTVIAYNSLQVVHDMDGTVREIARVLAPGGFLCACVAHPVTDLGRFTGEEDPPRLTIRDGYFESRRVEDRVEVGGHTMTFRGWTYSFEHYSLALERAGLRLEAMREPQPSAEGEAYARWRQIPLFLNFRAVKYAS